MTRNPGLRSPQAGPEAGCRKLMPKWQARPGSWYHNLAVE